MSAIVKNKTTPVVEAPSWKHLRAPSSQALSCLEAIAPKGLKPPALAPVIIDKAQFCLKNFKHLSSMSEETVCFSADVYFRGKKIAEARNSGQGGCTDLYTTDKEAYKAAEAWVDTLPIVSSRDGTYKVLERFSVMDYDSRHETNTKYDLEDLVYAMACNLEFIKSYKKLPNMVVAGPKGKGAKPQVLVYNKTVDKINMEVQKLQNGWVWAHSFENVVRPGFYHYYPCPHEFSGGHGSKEMHARVKETGETGIVCYFGTTDDQVVLNIDDKEIVFDAVELESFTPPKG